MSEIRKEDSLETQPYLKCRKCLQIEPSADWPKTSLGDSACKHCNQVNQAQQWPSAEISEFISLSSYYWSGAVGENPLLRLQMEELRSLIERLREQTEPTCPTCGQTLLDGHLKQILASLQREGIYRADRYRENRAKEKVASNKLKLFSVVLCCLAAEMILEEHLFVLAWTNHRHDESAHVMRALFEGSQGRTGRLSMFKRMSLRSYKNLCESLGFGKIYDDWEKVTRLRNKLLHGDTSEEVQKELGSIGPETLKTIFDGLLEVSRLDQNEYIRSFSNIYKSAAGNRETNG